MAYLSCPSVIINAPVEIVWTILMCPEKSTDVFDLRIVLLEPPGPAVVGQIISGETGPRVVAPDHKIALRQDRRCEMLPRARCSIAVRHYRTRAAELRAAHSRSMSCDLQL